MTSSWRAGGDFGGDPDNRQLGRNSADDTDLQPSVGQVIEHGDLLDNTPRRCIRSDRAEHAEAEPIGPCRNVREQQVR